MRRLTLHAALIGALLVVFGAGSYAVAGGGKRHVKTDLNGYLETPMSISTPASGEFDARIDDRNDRIHYTLSYENLEGAVTQAHIHFGQRATSGGISAWLCETAGTPDPVPTAPTPTCPAPGGRVTGTITPAEVVGPAGQGIAPGEFEELVRAIRAGAAYANVHSSTRPGGEIRGQINDRSRGDDDD
jgi:hypothetical protein